MPIKALPPALLASAQRALPAEVFKAAAAQAVVPPELLKGLTADQLQVVKQLADAFVAAPARAALPNAAGAGAHLPGVDPLAAAPAGPDPKTHNDPAAMHELFGKVVDDTTGLEKFEGEPLLTELRRRFFASHVTLTYAEARHAMFDRVDNHQGVVTDVYLGRELKQSRDGHIPFNDVTQFNTEHTWPQSQLKAAGKDAAVSDLHHIFPVDEEANTKRSSFPFGVVTTVVWQKDDARLGTDASGQMVFEPPAKHRGDVARAMFWIATAYQLDIPPAEEAVLKQWNVEDPVDRHEKLRDRVISRVQGDLNPFVLDPSLANQVDDF